MGRRVVSARQQVAVFLRSDLLTPPGGSDDDLELPEKPFPPRPYAEELTGLVPSPHLPPEDGGSAYVSPFADLPPTPSRQKLRAQPRAEVPSNAVGALSDAVDPDNDPRNKLVPAKVTYKQLVKNMISHYNGSNDDQRRMGRFWYKAAYDAAHALSQKSNGKYSPEMVSALLSAFSPQTDWDLNIKHAQHFMNTYDPNAEGFNPEHWRIANIHPAALAALKAWVGDRDLTDDDIDALADLHTTDMFRSSRSRKPGAFSDPANKAAWLANAKANGIKMMMDHHNRQVAYAKNKKPYAPERFMTDTFKHGDPIQGTLGGNLLKAKRLIEAGGSDRDVFRAILNGPKTGNFDANILDDTAIDDEGYYNHPLNSRTGYGDYRLGDLGVTADSHHMRASQMADGRWMDKAYASEDISPTDPYTYRVFHNATLDATQKINKSIVKDEYARAVSSGMSHDDAMRKAHSRTLTPKQVQAIIWLKHKDDREYFGDFLNLQAQQVGKDRYDYVTKDKRDENLKKLVRQRGHAKIRRSSSLGEYPQEWYDAFDQGIPLEWVDMLSSWVRHHDARLGPKAEQFARDILGGGDPDTRQAVRRHLAAYDPPEDEFSDVYDPFAILEESGPYSDPWTGADAEDLRNPCPYCHAAPFEPHDPRCPTNHADDPRDWAMDTRAIGPAGQWEFPPEHDPMLRVNQVLAYTDAVLKTAVPEHISPEYERDVFNAVMRSPKNPGITLHDQIGDMADAKWMVSEPHAEDRSVPFWMLTPQDISEYMDVYRDEVNADPTYGYGGWRGDQEGNLPGDRYWYNDISRSYDDPVEATEKAVDHTQWGVYNTPDDEYVPTTDMIDRYGTIL